jgi:hypothetical protein
MIGLCRPTSLFGRAIVRYTRAVYGHATLFGWSGDSPHRVLMIGETREHKDARSIDARSEIFAWPGCYDVFDVTVRDFYYNGSAAWAFACHAGGSKYGWRHITRVFGRRVLGLDVPAIPNSNDPQYPRDCSALVHAAFRLAGGKPLKEFDADVVPGDLSDPRIFRYRFTLFATRDQVEAYASSARAAA